jgi:hypothetical protein
MHKTLNMSKVILRTTRLMRRAFQHDNAPIVAPINISKEQSAPTAFIMVQIT